MSRPTQPRRLCPPALRTSALACLAAAAVCASAIGCASSSPVGALRFHNAPTAWKVNDRVDTPKKPDAPAFAKLLYHVDGFVVRRITRLLEVREPRRAMNVNAMDEVPDSTWFTNRIGVREMTVDEVRRGPNQGLGPEAHKPWTIKGTKVGGASVGFVMKDAEGSRYLLKFDVAEHPEMETAADVIAQRILHACGYNVPEDSIVYFTRDDLILADDAEVKDLFGNKRKMTAQDLDENLAKVYVEPDGRIRGLVSKFLPGVPLGGYSREGTRDGDPNDVIPHEHRRDLRGMYAILSWIAHTDMKQDNTLDMWVTDTADPDRRYVVHNLVDFGKSLGTMAILDRLPASTFAHVVDFEYIALSTLSFGLWKRPWEDTRSPRITGVGHFESVEYLPGKYKTHAPFFAFKDKDRFDAFWGAKILIRFTPEHIRAVVDEARYSDPRAADYITRTLIERQRKTARYWFLRVNPLDRFEVTDRGGDYELCFQDLMMVYQLDSLALTTDYDVAAYDYAGVRISDKSTRADASGRTCVSGLGRGAQRGAYTIVRIRTRRADGSALPATLVHLAADPATGQLRVIGLRRL